VLHTEWSYASAPLYTFVTWKKNKFAFFFKGYCSACLSVIRASGRDKHFVRKGDQLIFLLTQRGHHKFIFQDRVHCTSLRNTARYKHSERGWTVPSMIFSKWLAIWANGNARWDAGSWPERRAGGGGGQTGRQNL